MKRLLLVLSFLSIVGCGRLVAEHVVTGTPSSPSNGPVRIVMETDTPPAEFREIAIVRARGEGNRANLESVLEALQEEARLIGGNAVVRVRIDQGHGSISAIGTAGQVP